MQNLLNIQVESRLLHDYLASGCCGLPGGDGDSGKKCGEAAETKRRTVLSRRGLIRGKGKMVIFTMRPPSENVTKDRARRDE